MFWTVRTISFICFALYNTDKAYQMILSASKHVVAHPLSLSLTLQGDSLLIHWPRPHPPHSWLRLAGSPHSIVLLLTLCKLSMSQDPHFNFEDGNSIFLRNSGIYLWVHTVPQLGTGTLSRCCHFRVCPSHSIIHKSLQYSLLHNLTFLNATQESENPYQAIRNGQVVNLPRYLSWLRGTEKIMLSWLFWLALNKYRFHYLGGSNICCSIPCNRRS